MGQQVRDGWKEGQENRGPIFTNTKTVTAVTLTNIEDCSTCLMYRTSPNSLALTDEETESERGQATCSRSQAGGGRGR